MLTLPLSLKFPTKPSERISIGGLHGAALSLAVCETVKQFNGLILLITPNNAKTSQLERELRFFFQETPDLPIFSLPDWETLPYDYFSPHPDIISKRLLTLHQLPHLQKGILLLSVSTLAHRLCPRNYLQGSSFILQRGQQIDREDFRSTLEKTGYRCVSQVMEHGEFAVRGSLLDVFPMGSDLPYRIDLLDDEIDTLRSFDPETQRTVEVIEDLHLLPAHEFPLNQAAIERFRHAWREHFSGNPLQNPIYEGVSKGASIAGVEYYFPLFFDQTNTLFDYLPSKTLILTVNSVYEAAKHFWIEINRRYEQLRHDVTRPILSPVELFQPVEELFAAIKNFPQVQLQSDLIPEKTNAFNFHTKPLPSLTVDHAAPHPLHKLADWLKTTQARLLFCAETLGRREVLETLLSDLEITPKFFETWSGFLQDQAPIGITIAPLDESVFIETPAVVLITETSLFGEQVMQRRLRKQRTQDMDAVVRNLTELKIGSPVVHIEHGVGRYVGLQTITTGELECEYLTLEYEGAAKLYVPISSLHVINRYRGADLENAPLHRLGSGQWEKAKRKAIEKIRDVAAELLHIYAKRSAQSGFIFTSPDQHYLTFSASFPFEETPDQQQAIKQVIVDMTSERCMDRVVCGDVGFGKTEVAMRAAFLATQSMKQVAVLAPTTLLVEQHLHSFQDRFAKWPVRIEALSRFRTTKEQRQIIEDLKNGKIDIIIGTHKLLYENIQFKALGLFIVDEEHRFGVRQKDRIKILRAQVDMLTLTATPIPRTLNMALANLRDLSIIATPPLKRLSVKTFVREYSTQLIREAVLREILRGGQVYFLHNEVQSIERVAAELKAFLPEVQIGIAHGQMRESALERIMANFYHRRFNILVCTTIIESGIDIPTANTIIINRADRFGLAQLHQLRGRVGRSHHQAYAYLLTPPEQALTGDSKKRLTAIASMDTLGAGFLLAMQDLEIRGAGELLGEEQSGHIQQIGFSLYMELLEETVQALKKGKEPIWDKPLAAIEIDLKIPALIPSHYIPDVHTRLILYKRIANAKTTQLLSDLQGEMIDRFGLLPIAAKNLFQIAELKLFAESLSVRKVHVVGEEGVIEFNPNPPINMAALIALVQKQPKQFRVIGSEKLRFLMGDVSAEEKIEKLETLLKILKV